MKDGPGFELKEETINQQIEGVLNLGGKNTFTLDLEGNPAYTLILAPMPSVELWPTGNIILKFCCFKPWSFCQFVSVAIDNQDTSYG